MVAFRLQTVALCRLSEALLAQDTTTVLDFCAAILHTKLFPRIISDRQHESASPWFASIAQLVEHRSRKAGVIGSSPIAGSSCNVTPPFGEAFFVLRNPASVISSPLHRVLSLQRIRFHRTEQKLFDLLQFDGMDSPAFTRLQKKVRHFSAYFGSLLEDVAWRGSPTGVLSGAGGGVPGKTRITH